MGSISWGTPTVIIESILDPNSNLHLQKAEEALRNRDFDEAWDEMNYAELVANGNEEVLEQCRLIRESLEKTRCTAVAIQKYLDKLHKKAEQGDAESQYMLGMLYNNGYGVKEDTKKGFRLLLQAAKQNYDEAIFATACCMATGEGTEKNIAGAKELLLACAEQRNKKAYIYLTAICEIDGDNENILKYGLIGEKYDESGNLITIVADTYYILERYEEAFIYYNKSFERNIERAALGLGLCYLFGQGTKKDFIKAKQLLEQCIDNHYKEGVACCLLGETYIEDDAYKNVSLGIQYLEKSAQFEDSANFFLAKLYAEGKEVPMDNQKVFYYSKRAFDAGSEEILYPLALCYLNGVGGKVDVKKGILLLERAANNGDETAKKELEVVKKWGDFFPYRKFVTLAVIAWVVIILVVIFTSF